MGRLEDIVERNRNPRANRERLTVGIGMGLFVLLILALMVFTDLGRRPEAADAPPASARPGMGLNPTDHRVDGVLLRAPTRSRAGSASPGAE